MGMCRRVGWLGLAKPYSLSAYVKGGLVRRLATTIHTHTPFITVREDVSLLKVPYMHHEDVQT